MRSLFKTTILPLVAASFIAVLPSTGANAAVDEAVTAAFAGQKAKARQIMLRRGNMGHFNAMDANNSFSLTFPEMDQYFTAMHIAFDRNNDGMVSRQEAPKIMLRYSLSGKRFPAHGLSQGVMRSQLQNLFVKVDRNRNNVLSLGELMR